MRIVKYVINELGLPILFETNIIHSEMISNVVSAGFAVVDYDALTDQFKVKCYGGSESLRVHSERNDCLVIQNYLNSLLCKSYYTKPLTDSELNTLLANTRISKK